MIHLITGGQRSGKSSYGQQLALKMSDNPVYMATSRIWDEEHRQRVLRHQKDRDDRWHNIEEEKQLSNHDLSNRVVLVDCVTLWLTNFFFDNEYKVELALEKAKKEFDSFIAQELDAIIISNEVGMGVIPDTESGRKFADLQGWMNQYIAAKADKVTLMVSGLPLTIK